MRTSTGRFIGKTPFVPDGRDITWKMLKAHAAANGITLPTPPANFGHGTIYKDGEAAGDWQMNGNGPDDTVMPGFQGAGDCVFAAKAHTTRETNKIAGHTITITGKQSISDYSDCTGYVLGDDSTDRGTDMRAGHKYHAKTGILDAAGNRHKIGAYVLIDPSELAEAAFVFSAAEIGFAFQQAQDTQFDHGVWDYVKGSPNEGGHAIPVFGRHSGNLGIVSWAKHLYATPSFVSHLVDEAWGIVYPEELHNGKNERGLDLAGLNSMLAAIKK